MVSFIRESGAAEGHIFKTGVIAAKSYFIGNSSAFSGTSDGGIFKLRRFQLLCGCTSAATCEPQPKCGVTLTTVEEGIGMIDQSFFYHYFSDNRVIFTFGRFIAVIFVTANQLHSPISGCFCREHMDFCRQRICLQQICHM